METPQITDPATCDLLTLLDIAAPPGEELPVARKLTEMLVALGVPAALIHTDHAQQQSEYGGDIGNLIVRFDGTGAGPRRLLSAHMDTVPLAVGAKARIVADEKRIVNDAAGRALGGDNRTGCAVLLHAARTLVALDGQHAPVTLAFFVQEEVGLVGARGVELALLGNPLPAMGFNFDGSHADQLVTRVIGTERFSIHVAGIASHAGANPGDGVSAAVIAGRALAALDEAGWHGPIEKPAGAGSANVGRIAGGLGSNIVMPEVDILAEARAHDPEFRARIIDHWRKAFSDAAAQVHNTAGQSGCVSFSPGPTYEAFALADQSPVVRAAFAAAERSGIIAQTVSNNGGMDANWIVAHGIPTVTIGAGQREVHTPDEWIDLADFQHACRIAGELVQAATS